jgi:hypothetical protein
VPGLAWERMVDPRAENQSRYRLGGRAAIVLIRNMPDILLNFDHISRAAKSSYSRQSLEQA